jgi:hypothetical protein
MTAVGDGCPRSSDGERPCAAHAAGQAIGIVDSRHRNLRLDRGTARGYVEWVPMRTASCEGLVMPELKISPQNRAAWGRIQALPINAAHRDHALAELERAEASVARLIAAADRLQHSLQALRRTFVPRRQRLG